MSLATETAASAGAPAETPSGKGAADENFPVGSALLPKRLRPHVATYYAFARAIDDIADHPDLEAAEKIARLNGFGAALNGETGLGAAYDKAYALRRSLKETGVTTQRGADLVAAFLQDAVKTRYAAWEDLIGYCRLSANPVGQYLLDLHGEEAAGYRYADALSTVLQIVNHLQDCGEDRRTLDRVYVIGDWLAEEGGAVEDLDKPAMTPALRRVCDRMLDGCDALMEDARRLPGMVQNRRLAMESAVIVRLAERLIARLRRGDPLAARVALSKVDFAASGVAGVVAGFVSAGRGRRP